MDEMGAYIQKLAKSGVLTATDGLLPSSLGAKVRLSSGKLTITDGRFTEAKELIAGFAILNVESEAEAISHAPDFLRIAGDGETEIRRMYDTPAYWS
ncbi:MAG TPA: YciI family protein [Spirochaetia bacterium]|nr:YciI family protein [Spirochaetia bacterium]